MKDHIEEMEELGIPSIILSTKDDVLLPIGEAKYKLLCGTAVDFLDAKFQNVLKNEDSPLLYLRYTIVSRLTPSCLGSTK